MGNLFRFSADVQAAYENLQTPISIFQYTETGVLPVVVSEGFCELFEFDNFEEAYDALNEDSFSIIHTGDVKRIKDEILRFLAEEGRLQITAARILQSQYSTSMT